MSLPVSAQGGKRPHSARTRAPLAKVRLMGPPEAVAEIARRLRQVLDVVEESADHPRRRDLGVRRYLTVLVPREVPPASAKETTG